MTTLSFDRELSNFVDPDTCAAVWDAGDGLPAHVVAWAQYDGNGDFNPHEDEELILFVAEGHRWVYADCSTLRGILNEGLTTEGIEQQIYEQLDPLAVERFDFGDHSEGTMWAYVPNVTAFELLGPPQLSDPVEWLTNATPDRMREIARERLDGHIAEFKTWDTYGSLMVYAANLRTGAESFGLHGVIDEYPFKYALEVAKEQAEDVA